MAGGTFTISNGGVFGSMMGTPIINLPQTAVLGLHAIKERPMAINGKVEIRPVCVTPSVILTNTMALSGFRREARANDRFLRR